MLLLSSSSSLAACFFWIWGFFFRLSSSSSSHPAKPLCLPYTPVESRRLYNTGLTSALIMCGTLTTHSWGIWHHLFYIVLCQRLLIGQTNNRHTKVKAKNKAALTFNIWFCSLIKFWSRFGNGSANRIGRNKIIQSDKHTDERSYECVNPLWMHSLKALTLLNTNGSAISRVLLPVWVG